MINFKALDVLTPSVQRKLQRLGTARCVQRNHSFFMKQYSFKR